MYKPILHLNLKKKWFDMIASGEKKEEYRDIKPYWQNKFIDYGYKSKFCVKIKNKRYSPSEIIICFSNGYDKDRKQMFFKCKDAFIGYGNIEWGAELFKRYFVLSLGEKINV